MSFNNTIPLFNIRVYALIINEKNEILLADEERFGIKMTKFPGGGLQYGEGTKECLKREAQEEFNQGIEITDHFYTTDYFQKSWFRKNQQLIAIYYCAKFSRPEKFRIARKPFDFKKNTKELLSFRYQQLITLSPDELTLPVDRLVLELIRKKFYTKK